MRGLSNDHVVLIALYYWLELTVLKIQPLPEQPVPNPFQNRQHCTNISIPLLQLSWPGVLWGGGHCVSVNTKVQ
jgi:hypothetical protein